MSRDKGSNGDAYDPETIRAGGDERSDARGRDKAGKKSRIRSSACGS